MSAVPDFFLCSAVAPRAPQSPANNEAAWRSYRNRIANWQQHSDAATTVADRLAYQRQCALDYLGKRAQLHGGVCERKTPRILTAQLVSDLGATNQEVRYRRYPWLKTLLSLMMEIELIQSELTAAPVPSHWRLPATPSHPEGHT